MSEQQDALFSFVAENATTANHPEIPDSSTCKQSLQVGQLTVGMTVYGQHGPAEIVGIEVSRWRFSMKPKCRLTFRDIATGEKYEGSYFPDAPLDGNHQIHHANNVGSQLGYSSEKYQTLAEAAP